MVIFHSYVKLPEGTRLQPSRMDVAGMTPLLGAPTAKPQAMSVPSHRGAPTNIADSHGQIEALSHPQAHSTGKSLSLPLLIHLVCT